MRVDHENSEEVEELFKRIAKEQDGRLDILVNNAYKGVEVRGIPVRELRSERSFSAAASVRIGQELLGRGAELIRRYQQRWSTVGFRRKNRS